MAAGVSMAGCSYCRGPHPTGMCLTWIVAHDPGAVPQVPERHMHCERCGRGLTVTLEQLRDASPRGVVQSFIRTHATCRPRR
jgi:hypothetical protein